MTNGFQEKSGMIHPMIFSLNRRLERWVRDGIITHVQASQIMEYEKGVGNRPWVTFGIVGIGITAIVTGVISLVAANWESIPVALKLLNYFLLQGGVGVLFLFQQKKEGVWRETFLTLFAFLFWAGIGLFSQVFNLEGQGWSACLFWLVLTLPAVCIARHTTFPHLWSLLLIVTASWWTLDPFNPITDDNVRAMVSISVPILLSALAFWAQAMLRLSPFLREAFTYWGIGLFAIGGTILGNIFWESGHVHIAHDSRAYLLIPWFSLLLAILGSLARSGKVKKELCALTAVFLFFLGVYLTIPVLFENLGSPAFRQIAGATGFIALGGLAATISAMANMKRLYETATRLIALRFIIVYFQVFGSLTKTGVGLVFSGIIVLAFAYFWHRMKSKLLKAFQSIGGKR